MRERILMAVAVVFLAGSAGAQSTPPSGSFANAVQPAPIINQAGSFGIGPMLGEPMGLTTKFWLTDQFAVDGAVGWSFVEPDGCQLHSDILWHPFELCRSEEGALSFYFGVGARGKFVDHGDNIAGLRGPVGLSWMFGRHPIEIFAEVAPCFDLTPSRTLNWNGVIGLRFYFH